jgi:hypothetical protein
MPAPLPHASPGLATRDDIDRLSRELAEIKAIVERHDASLKMGLTRMGQLQADIDQIRNAWTKLKPGI